MLFNFVSTYIYISDGNYSNSNSSTVNNLNIQISVFDATIQYVMKIIRLRFRITPHTMFNNNFIRPLPIKKTQYIIYI